MKAGSNVYLGHTPHSGNPLSKNPESKMMFQSILVRKSQELWFKPVLVMKVMTMNNNKIINYDICID